MTTEQIKAFILAGNAVFTVSNGKPAPDARDFTFKVAKKELDSWDGRNPTTKKPVYFVALLTGSDNETDYKYLGVLDPDNGRVRPDAQSTLLPTTTPYVAIAWVLGHIWAGKALPGGATLTPHVEGPQTVEQAWKEDTRKSNGLLPRKPRTKKAPKPTFEQLRAQAAAAALAADGGLGLPAPPVGRTLAFPEAYPGQAQDVEEFLGVRSMGGRFAAEDSVDRAERALGVQ